MFFLKDSYCVWTSAPAGRNSTFGNIMGTMVTSMGTIDGFLLATNCGHCHRSDPGSSQCLVPDGWHQNYSHLFSCHLQSQAPVPASAKYTVRFLFCPHKPQIWDLWLEPRSSSCLSFSAPWPVHSDNFLSHLLNCKLFTPAKLRFLLSTSLLSPESRDSSSQRWTPLTLLQGTSSKVLLF